jgi:hypothetical protein
MRDARTVSRRGGAGSSAAGVSPAKPVTPIQKPRSRFRASGLFVFATFRSDHQLVHPRPQAVPCRVFGAQTLPPACEAAAFVAGWMKYVLMALAANSVAGLTTYRTFRHESNGKYETFPCASREKYE